MKATSRIGATIIAAASGVFLAASASAQQSPPAPGDSDSVMIEIDLRPDRSFAYAFDTEVDIVQRGAEGDADAADLPDQNLEYEAEVRFTVVAVQPDGARTLNATVWAYEAEWEEGDAEREYSRGDLERLRGRLDEVFEDAGDLSPADRLFVALARATIVVELAPDNSVASVAGLEGFGEAVRASDDIDDRFLGFFTNDAFADLVGPIFTADGAVGTRRLPGQAWQTAKTVDLSNIAAMDYAYDWSVVEIDDDEVTLRGEAQITVRRPTNPDDLRPNVALRSAEETVVTEWDADERLVEEREAEYSTSLAFTWSGQDRSIRLEQVATGVTEADLIPLDELGWTEDEDDDENDDAETDSDDAE